MKLQCQQCGKIIEMDDGAAKRILAALEAKPTLMLLCPECFASRLPIPVEMEVDEYAQGC